MKTNIIKFEIVNELDIVLAHKRASQICDLVGIGISGRTSFVTAISEICRNCLEHAGSGTISFNICHSLMKVEAIIEDKGPGIQNLDLILNKPITPGTKGCGLQYSRKLVDSFVVETSDSGTLVNLGMKITSKSIPINQAIVKGWSQYFKEEKDISPYEEIKRQNMQLLELAEQLRLKNLEGAEQYEKIKDLNFQLNRNNQELEDFAYTISHDFKNPISNMKLLISMLENNNDAAQREEYFKLFLKMVLRLDQMLTGLIEIIDLKNNQEDIAKEVAFIDILNVIKEELKAELSENNGIILHDFSSKPTIVYYNLFLHSILQNLITNALKYRDLQNSPSIKISTYVKSDYTVLQIQDNGIGIDLDSVRKFIFKPFKRFHNQAEGKGIGLYLVKNMVEKNGGKVEIESEPGKGTVFTLYLKEYNYPEVIM
jgi:signal transduction histidine kinase